MARIFGQDRPLLLRELQDVFIAWHQAQQIKIDRLVIAMDCERWVEAITPCQQIPGIKNAHPSIGTDGKS